MLERSQFLSAFLGGLIGALLGVPPVAAQEAESRLNIYVAGTAGGARLSSTSA
jgi:hypothetical protein